MSVWGHFFRFWLKSGSPAVHFCSLWVVGFSSFEQAIASIGFTCRFDLRFDSFEASQSRKFSVSGSILILFFNYFCTACSFFQFLLYRLEIHGMLSGVFHLLCRFEIHAMLSGVFHWYVFWHFPVECLRAHPREMLSGIFQWNAFGRRGVFGYISVESFWANSGEMLWGILLGPSWIDDLVSLV